MIAADARSIVDAAMTPDTRPDHVAGSDARWLTMLRCLAALPWLTATLLILLWLRPRLEFGGWPTGPFSPGAKAVRDRETYFGVQWWVTCSAYIGSMFSLSLVPFELVVQRCWRWLAAYVVGWIALAALLVTGPGTLDSLFD